MASPFAHTEFPKWFEANKEFFVPPICNKLLHGGQLKIMFCGGKKANERGDYHIEDGEEFFYMMKGSMVLKVLEGGKHRSIEIKEGETFLLPAHVPHSPQRFPDSLGLVIERERVEGEIDAMQWFVPGSTDVLWRRTFVCRDLGKDLVPIVTAFKASVEAKTKKRREAGARGEDGKLSIMPLKESIDTEAKLGDPKCISSWLESKSEDFKIKEMYKGKDFLVRCGTGVGKVEKLAYSGESYYYLLTGTAELTSSSVQHKVKLSPQSMVVIDAQTEHSLELFSKDSHVVMVTWHSAPKTLESTSPPMSAPELVRDCSYANHDLRKEDYFSS